MGPSASRMLLTELDRRPAARRGWQDAGGGAVTIRLAGSFAVVRDGRSVAPGAAMGRAWMLLKLLAVERGRTVARSLGR